MTNSNIGTVDEAETAFLLHLYAQDWNNQQSVEGWDYLGSGIHRTAYSSPSGFVYKVPSEIKNRRCCEANESEALGAKVLSEMESDEFGVPLTNLFRVGNDIPIIVMENLGDDGYWLDDGQARRAKAFFRNTDTHGGNMREKDGKVYMIDLGFFSVDGASSDDYDVSARSCGCCACCACECGRCEDCGLLPDWCECCQCDHGLHIDDFCQECNDENC